MADASLDDFFAKKDKSKKKGKSKYTANDILSQSEEKPKVLKKKKVKEPPQAQETPSENSEPKTQAQENAKNEEDEQWADYTEETETDYSGLRIQNLQIRDENESEKENENKEDGEDGDEKSEGGAGVWNVAVPAATPTEEEEEEEKPAPEPEPVKEEQAKTPGKYIPPSMRAGGAASQPAMRPSPLVRGRGKKSAPNLQSEEDFPTLGGGPSPMPMDDGSGSKFEKVRSGGRQQGDPSQQRQKLELGNKFDALTGGTD